MHNWRHFSFGQRMLGEIIAWSLYHKANKEASTVLCSVVKHLGSGTVLKKWGKTLDCVSCFPLHFFRALPLPACFTTEQSTVEASLFVKSKCHLRSWFLSTCCQNLRTRWTHSVYRLAYISTVKKYLFSAFKKIK